MANPAFSNSPAFSAVAAQKLAARQNGVPPVPTPGQLQEHYGLPDATPDQMERMTYQDTIFKTLAGFAVLLVGAAIGWVFPVLAIVGLIAGLVLALVNIFKKKPSPGLILAYAFAEGLLVGGVSMFFSQMWDGIVPMALLGTLGVVGVTLALFANGKVRVSKRATQIFLVAIVGYAAFSLINVVLMMTGVVDSFGGMRDFEILGIPLGIPLGILVVLLAAYSLVMDFDYIQQGVRTGQPRIYGWTAAFGIIVTVVWLYLEILRLLSYFLPRN
ncbi:Bax inhibitor-1/YccA family protein [Pseudolysinimonas sp.]|uniref:Bax inhibitor-1/YccA family protein n=1 Tax=Pseudolysinimonas sp. TaxID=2680009 RepID=UPI00286A53FC|nr:Bax inhibitor-1/YccA family protein [Pseudolysinimonas sp.]